MSNRDEMHVTGSLPTSGTTWGGLAQAWDEGFEAGLQYQQTLMGDDNPYAESGP